MRSERYALQVQNCDTNFDILPIYHFHFMDFILFSYFFSKFNDLRFFDWYQACKKYFEKERILQIWYFVIQ